MSFSSTCGVTKKTLLDFQKADRFGGLIWPVISIVHSCNQFDPDLFTTFIYECVNDMPKEQDQRIGIRKLVPEESQQYYGMLQSVA